MNILYPEIEPYASDFIKTDDGHSIYYEQSGNLNGIPVIFLHGGPGSGCNENHRRYFNPEKYRIVIFDQRGCNRSTPNGSTENNTTQTLLQDIEAIRIQLNIDKWVLFGGSWGATLALLYAEQYPKHVAGIIVRGTFLARQTDLDWFASGQSNSVSSVFPDYWNEFISFFSHSEQTERLKILHKKIFSDDKNIQLEAAKAWSLWAGRVVTHSLSLEEPYALELDGEDDESKLINEVKIEMHFANNKYFINENQILDNISLIPKVPVNIIHGRRDLTCLPDASWSVYQALKELNFENLSMNFVVDAGHLASEPTMVDALISATDEMAALL